MQPLDLLMNGEGELGAERLGIRTFVYKNLPIILTGRKHKTGWLDEKAAAIYQ